MIVHIDIDKDMVGAAAKALEELAAHLNETKGGALPQHVYVGEDGEIDDAPEMAYVAARPCGCIDFAATDWAAHNGADESVEIRDCLREGISVERVPSQVVRKRWNENGCPECNPPEQMALALEEND